MRSFVASALLAVCASSHASFELALIPDGTSKTVHRYDVSTGIYLGAFGQNHFGTAPGAIALNQSLSTAYVVDGGSIRKFNYNTGEYLGAFSTGLSAIKQINVANDGRLLVTSGSLNTLGYIFSAAGSYLNVVTNGYMTANGRLMAVAQYSNGYFGQWMNDGPGIRYAFNANENAAATSWITGGTANTCDLAVSGNFGSCNYTTDYSNWFRFTQQAGSLGGFITPASAPAMPSGYSTTGLSWGHVDPYSVATNGTASQIAWYDGSSNVVYTYALPGQIANARDIAIVTAPEPASMAAFGIGILGLLRRKNRRVS